MQRQTTLVKPAEVKNKWYVVDATGLPLGRLASQVALVLMGKTKANYTPTVDGGDFVIIINAEKVSLSGNKVETKKYYNNSQYAGGLRTRTAGVMLADYPEEMVERSVWGMLPKGRLGHVMHGKLFVYRGAKHEHEAQKPEVLKVTL
ncbi:MAG: 50S ribosomal protein L13 [Firmicutes bacterium]|nr:50S ribosomal protein L13 [Bacillota bacterium]